MKKWQGDLMISVIIPFHPDLGPRDKAFNWIRKYYEIYFPSAEKIIARSKAPFNKSKAINEAAKNSKGSIIVIADADIVINPRFLRKAIKMLDSYPWIIPYNDVLDLTRVSTNRLLQTNPSWPLLANLEFQKRKTKNVIPVGGLNIIKRECFESAGGFDERFQGWGGEDDAFAAAMNTFCGHYKRVDQSIYHLWHPRSKPSDNRNYHTNFELALRYCKAQGNKSEMRKIIQERGNS
ncbi:glycosyltransferase [Cytobacillus firmus]|uniref:glycosyltransferase n=1 Tax=Cytobacillus firmus TaxID=1399 RepID=UPI0036B5860A